MQLFNVLPVMIFIGILCSICDHAAAIPVIRRASDSVQYQNGTTLKPECTLDSDCFEHSTCRNGKCTCDKGWLTWRNSRPCSYEQRSKTVALIVSILLGSLGVDWFVLARGTGNYIFAGIMKLLVSSGCIGIPLLASEKVRAECGCCAPLLSLGGLIWWIVDWARILADSFHDGNGAPLASW